MVAGRRRSLVLAIAIAASCSVSGCVATLPFDELTGGPPKPLSRFAFEEGSGTTAFDSVGQGQALLEGDEVVPLWTAEGKRGGGLEFAATDSWLYIPSFSEARFPQRGTIAVWVRLRGFLASDVSDLFGVEEDDGVSEEFQPIALFADDQAVTLGLWTRAGGSTELTTPPVEVGAWTLIVAGWDIPANRALLYVRPDGKPAHALQSSPLPPGFSVTTPYVLFSAGNGVADELLLYDRLLSDDEVARLE